MEDRRISLKTALITIATVSSVFKLYHLNPQRKPSLKVSQILCGHVIAIFVFYASSTINEGIRALLNFFIIFFTKRFHTHKKHKTHTSEQKQKKQHFFMHIKNI